MSFTSDTTEHEAVKRLFDLSRVGEVDNVEFAQLDSLVYRRLAEAYDDVAPVQDAHGVDSIS
ncbi:MAG TPA: hypothetical protein VLK29_05945 [Luteimonas sp.]|nr:hypothetical protein [Luteimonas sp.]